MRSLSCGASIAWTRLQPEIRPASHGRHFSLLFEIALREMGVGDISVPKQMKTIAEAFRARRSL